MLVLSDICFLLANKVCSGDTRLLGFLTRLYLDDSAVIEPPKGGWPTITKTGPENLD